MQKPASRLIIFNTDPHSASKLRENPVRKTNHVASLMVHFSDTIYS